MSLLISPQGMATVKISSAKQVGDQDAALGAIRRGEILPYGRIKRRAEKQLQGRLVGERLRQTGQGWVYEVRVRRPDGRVVFGILDARTGQLIGRGGRR